MRSAPRHVLFEETEELDRLANWLEPQLLDLYQGKARVQRTKQHQDL